MNPDRIKHLEFIQAVATRLAGNSFLMKGWTVTIVAALFALAAKDANSKDALIALLPALFFWGLDAYYLRQERLFRALYDAARMNDSPIPVFSMDTEPVAVGVDGWPQTLVAEVEAMFYLPVLASIALAYFLTH